MSTGWTYGVLGAVTWFLGLIDDRAAEEVWGDDTDGADLLVHHAGREGDGGRRRLPPLSGHWRYASGCEHCDWALLGGMVHAEHAPPDWRFFVVPRQDYETVDTWQVAGLQGTGSIDVILDDVFVPDLSHAAPAGQLPAQGRRAGDQHVGPLPAAVRADFRARRVDRRPRRACRPC